MTTAIEDSKEDSAAPNTIADALDQIEAEKTRRAGLEADQRKRRAAARAAEDENKQKHRVDVVAALVARLGRQPTPAEVATCEYELDLAAIRWGSRFNRDVVRVEAPNRENRRGAPRTQREASRGALLAIYPPSGDPGREKLEAVVRSVNDYLKESGGSVVSKDTVRRAIKEIRRL